MNIRSLNKNYDNLTYLNHFPSILKIWLKPSTAPLNEILEYKSYHTHWHYGYGGVAFYVKDNLPSTIFSDYCICTDTIEHCTAKVTVGKTSYIISLYRPNSKHHQINEFTDFMDNLISRNIFLTTNPSLQEFSISTCSSTMAIHLQITS